LKKDAVVIEAGHRLVRIAHPTSWADGRISAADLARIERACLPRRPIEAAAVPIRADGGGLVGKGRSAGYNEFVRGLMARAHRLGLAAKYMPAKPPALDVVNLGTTLWLETDPDDLSFRVFRRDGGTIRATGWFLKDFDLAAGIKLSKSAERFVADSNQAQS